MIAYATRTGNVRYIINKLQLPAVEITSAIQLTQPFILFTYTDGLGSVPLLVENFMERNFQNCRGVIASGNSNFGHDVFCNSAKIINEKYGIPIVRKIELRGFQSDYDAIMSFYEQHFSLEATYDQRIFKAQ